MEPTTCSTCQKPKANYKCGICASVVCKSCAQLVASDSFAFLTDVSEELTRGTYCYQCFDSKVEPELSEYNSLMDRARKINVFYKKQSKESRIFKRTAAQLKVENCADRDEALLRLAFMAARLNYNMLVDVDLSAQKVRHAGYQTSRWQAVGIPVNSLRE